MFSTFPCAAMDTWYRWEKLAAITTQKLGAVRGYGSHQTPKSIAVWKEALAFGRETTSQRNSRKELGE